MRKILSITLYNLKKDKSSYISFGIVILITALILNCAIVLLFQVDKAYNNKFSKLNTASLNVIVPASQNANELLDDIRTIYGVDKFETHKAILTEATIKNFKDSDFTMNTIFYNLDSARNINNFKIVEKSELDVKNPIYIPLYVAKFGEFSLNEEIVYMIDGKSFTFTVAGIIEEMQYGNYGSGLLCAYVPNKEYLDFAESFIEDYVIEFSFDTCEGTTIDKVKDEMIKTFESETVYDIDSHKHFDINLGGAKKITIKTGTNEKIRIKLTSDTLEDISSLFKVKLDEKKGKLDVELVNKEGISRFEAQENIDITLLLPDKFTNHCEISASVKELCLESLHLCRL